MNEQTDPTEDEETERLLDTELNVNRRSLMKVAGAAGLLTGAGSASAQEECPSCGTAQSPGPDLCRNCDELDPDCEFDSKSNKTDGKCFTGDVPPDATDAVIKAANECIFVDDLSGDICVPDGCPGFSHIEFYICPQPRVTGLSATCDTLTIETADTEKGDSLSVDYRLQLVDDSGNVLETPVDADDVSTTVQSDNGDATITLSDDTSDSWNRVAIDEVVHEDSTDMLAEADLSKPQFRDTVRLCNPPAVTGLEADCTTLTINTEHAANDALSVDYTLQLVDDSGNVLEEPASFTDESTTVDGSNVATITLGDDTSDSWNRVKVTSVVHDQTGTEMLSSTQTRDTPTLCNAPSVTGLAADCTTLTINTEHADGDMLEVDYTLQLLDSDGNLEEMSVETIDDVSTTVDSNGDTTITVGDHTPTDESWNRVRFDEVIHVQTGTEMLANSEEVSKPAFRNTPELCNPPEVTATAFSCDTIFIETNAAAEGDNLDVDFKLDRIDVEGTDVQTGSVLTANDEGTAVDSDGLATVDIGGIAASNDLYNVVDLISVENKQTGTEMLADSVKDVVVANNSL